jgi:hypothetical protein
LHRGSVKRDASPDKPFSHVFPFSPRRFALYNDGPMDSFTYAVLAGGALVLVIFVLMIALDKKGPEAGTKG